MSLEKDVVAINENFWKEPVKEKEELKSWNEIIGKVNETKGTKVVYDGPNAKVIKIGSQEDFKKYAAGTPWLKQSRDGVAGEMFDQHVGAFQSNIYIIQDKAGHPLYVVEARPNGRRTVFDENDSPLSAEDAAELMGGLGIAWEGPDHKPDYTKKEWNRRKADRRQA